MAAGDAISRPECLEKLTTEHDDIVAAHYPDPWGASRDYEWQYAEYLNPTLY